MDEENAQKFLDNLQQIGVAKIVDDDLSDVDEMKIPPWFDAVKFKRAQKFFQTNIFAVFLGQLYGLIALFSIPSVLNILASTKQSGSPMTAYRRYITTLLHINLWYEDELEPGSKSWKSLKTIRTRHFYASKTSRAAGFGIINQKDMVLTQFALMGFTSLRPDMLGVQGSASDLDAFTHFWRVIGFVLGIKDEFNLCSPERSETQARLKVILDKVYTPAMTETSDLFYEMTDVMIQGLWCYNPLLDTEAFLYLTKRIANVDGYHFLEADSGYSDHRPNYDKLKSNWSKFIVFFLTNVQMNWLQNLIARFYFNMQIHISDFFTKWFPLLAICKFGEKYAYVKM